MVEKASLVFAFNLCWAIFVFFVTAYCFYVSVFLKKIGNRQISEYQFDFSVIYTFLLNIVYISSFPQYIS